MDTNREYTTAPMILHMQCQIDLWTYHLKVLLTCHVGLRRAYLVKNSGYS